MDHGPESKKARLSGTGAQWAPSWCSSSSPVSSTHNHPAALHHSQPPPQQQQQHPFDHATQPHNPYNNHPAHPTPAPNGPPYQTGHSSSAAPSGVTTTVTIASSSSPTSSFPNHHPGPGLLPPALSPAPPTPVSAHSYTNTTTLPPPLSSSSSIQVHGNSTQTNGRLAHGHPHHLDDRRRLDPNPYSASATQNSRHPQDYRPPPQSQSQSQSHPQPPPSADYRPDYRFPTSSHPGHVGPSGAAHPSSPASAGPYGRSDNKRSPQFPPNDDAFARNRPESAASAAGAHGSQHSPPTPQHQHQHHHKIDGNRHSMSYDNLPPPNAGDGHHHSAHSQHQQHTQHSPYTQHPPPLPPPSMHAPQPPPPPGPNPVYRPPSYPSTPTLSQPLPLSQHQQQLQQHPQHQHQPHPPPPPPSAPPAQHYEPQPMYNHTAPQSTEAMYAISYAASAAGKKKAQRASQACDSCRSLKAKCDETKPCKNCREKNIECKYRDPIPKQQDKVSTDILDSINMMHNFMRNMQSELVQRISTLENAVKTNGTIVGSSDLRQVPGDSTPGKRDMVKANIEDDNVATGKPALQEEELQLITRQMDDNYTVHNIEPGPTVPPGEPAIPAHHTTLAGLLLTWPTINERVDHLLKAEGIHFLHEYPIRQEEQRGDVRLYGRGEGFGKKKKTNHSGGGGHHHHHHHHGGDHSSQTAQPTSVPLEYTPSSRSSQHGSGDGGVADSDDASPSPSSPYPADIWGQLGTPDPPAACYYSDGAHGSSLRPDGKLDFSPDKVWKYVKSYEDNIQNIHPLIIPKELRAMVTVFLNTLPKPASTARSASATMGAGPGAPLSASSASSSFNYGTLSTFAAPPLQSSRFSAPAPVASFAASPNAPLHIATTPAPAFTQPLTAHPFSPSSPAPRPLVESGIKRKRSPTFEGAGPTSGMSPSAATAAAPSSVSPYLRSGVPFRNVESALVLSILALGKICLHKHGRLPDVVPEEDAGSPPPNGPPSPGQTPGNMNGGGGEYSPSPYVHNSPILASGDGGGGGSSTPSRRTSLNSGSGALPGVDVAGAAAAAAAVGGVSAAVGGMPMSSAGVSSRDSHRGGPCAAAQRRNIDEIPGLDYFAAACDIIGGHFSGRELKHVWVLILGCLYYGQLGRPIESLEMVAMAGRHLQAIIRPSLYRYSIMRSELNRTMVSESEVRQHPRDNQYIFAFWTCLQLESDILAELQLPPSGVLSYEQQMPYPSADVSLQQGFDEYVLQSYAAQLYLRNQLNDIHKNLYDGRQDQRRINIGQIDVFVDALQTHKWVPWRFSFNDDDPPAQDILAARLRAKYWGAQVIVHRFFIRRILEINFYRRKRDEAKKTAADAAAARGEDPDAAAAAAAQRFNPAVFEQEDEAFTKHSLQLACRGVKALVESTRAFHGLPEKRFIITNVFGTAHAQWGNLLVLDSIQRDPVLGRYITNDLVNGLFRKTIAFFEVVSQPTSSLGYDLRILKGLYSRRLTHPITIPQEPPPLPPKPAVPPSGADSSFQMPMSYPMMAGSGMTHSSEQSTEWFLTPGHLGPPPPRSSSVRLGSRSPQQQKQQHLASYPGPPVPPAAMAAVHSSPMQMSPSSASPIPLPFDAGPGAIHTSMPSSNGAMVPVPQAAYAPQSAQGSAIQSPVQSRPPPPFGVSSVKTPSTPSESGFPHSLPPYDQRR